MELKNKRNVFSSCEVQNDDEEQPSKRVKPNGVLSVKVLYVCVQCNIICTYHTHVIQCTCCMIGCEIEGIKCAFIYLLHILKWIILYRRPGLH